MTTVYEVPLATRGVSQGSVRFRIDLFILTVTLTLRWNPSKEGGWVMDIGDADGNPLACGIPLVTGCNLVDPYPQLGLPPMWVATDGDPYAVPTFSNLGVESHLYFAL